MKLDQVAAELSKQHKVKHLAIIHFWQFKYFVAKSHSELRSPQCAFLSVLFSSILTFGSWQVLLLLKYLIKFNILCVQLPWNAKVQLYIGIYFFINFYVKREFLCGLYKIAFICVYLQLCIIHTHLYILYVCECVHVSLNKFSQNLLSIFYVPSIIIQLNQYITSLIMKPSFNIF